MTGKSNVVRRVLIALVVQVIVANLVYGDLSIRNLGHEDPARLSVQESRRLHHESDLHPCGERLAHAAHALDQDEPLTLATLPDLQAFDEEYLVLARHH